MKLYYTKSACSLVCRIIINELGLPCEYESVDLSTKKTETGQDFAKINPKGAVPTLQLDNGEVLTENAVILQYLADTAIATQLLPTLGDFKRYRVLEWLNYVATELHKGIGALFNPKITPEIRENIFVPLIKNKLNFLDKHLQNHKYLQGEQFTLPDAYCFVMITWLYYFKFNVSEWSNILRYFNELKKRKSVADSLAQEGLHSSSSQ